MTERSQRTGNLKYDGYISIGLIRWPDDKTLSVRLYLNFLIEVTDLLNIDFDGDNNPIRITKKYVGGLITDEDRKLALSYWWKCIDDKNIRNFNLSEVITFMGEYFEFKSSADGGVCGVNRHSG
ncbi:hypothetical protein [Pectobacterium sp. B1J-3]|uniref:hypothetical protein n=1 Tax=Pectobacterium sp. B1J-3 TaxID=3385371 RepID=UPI0039064204